jgi:hypothetical protein
MASLDGYENAIQEREDGEKVALQDSPARSGHQGPFFEARAGGSAYQPELPLDTISGQGSKLQPLSNPAPGLDV